MAADARYRFRIVGRAGDVGTALACRLAELVAASHSTVADAELELVHPHSWDSVASRLASQFGFSSAGEVPSPLVSGQGKLIGGATDFVVHCQDAFGVSVDLDPPELRLRAAEDMAGSDAESRQAEVLRGCLRQRRALVVVDVQKDFCEGGSLAVPRADEIIEVVNSVRDRWSWDLVVLTQDWHPAEHASFASNNEGAELFEVRDLPDAGAQVMWPDHCVQGSEGAEFHPSLACSPGRRLEAGDDPGDGPDPDADSSDWVVRKGTVRSVDSYSGFGDASEDKSRELTPLLGLLRSRGIATVVVVGLAQDFCVSFTARDARRFGFDTVLLTDGTRGITSEGVDKEMELCQAAGVVLIESKELPTRELEAEARREAGLEPWSPFCNEPAAAAEEGEAGGGGATASA